jgi:hypothetical protein
MTPDPQRSFTPEQWMRVTVKELWMFAISTMWWKHQCNTELHGTDGAISLKTKWKEMALEAVSVFQRMYHW